MSEVHGKSSPIVLAFFSVFGDQGVKLRQAEKKNYVPAAAILILASLVISVLSLRGPVSSWHARNDFAHYYITSNLLVDGIDPYRHEISDQYQLYGFENMQGQLRATNPPPLAVLFAPLSTFHPQLAWIMWQGIQILAFLISLLFLARLLECRWNVLSRVGFFTAAAVSYPVLSHLQFGQVQLLLLAIILTGVFLIKRESLLGSFLFGLASSLKLFTFPLLYVALRAQKLGGGLAFLLGFLLPYGGVVLLFGIAPLESFLSITLPYIQKTALSLSGNLSFSFAVYFPFYFFRYGSQVPYQELQTLTFLLNGTAAVFLLGLLIVDYGRSREKFSLLRSTSVCLVGCCLFAPTAWPHYLVLTLPAFALLLLRGASFPKLAFLYFGISITQGFIVSAPPLLQFLSAWWGVGVLGFLLFSLLACEMLASDQGVTD